MSGARGPSPPAEAIGPVRMAGRATLTGMLVAVALAVLAIGSLAWLLNVAPSALFGIRAAADYQLGLQALALGLIPITGAVLWAAWCLRRTADWHTTLRAGALVAVVLGLYPMMLMAIAVII